MSDLLPLTAHLLALSCYLYAAVFEARRQQRDVMTCDLLVSFSYALLCLDSLHV